MRKDNIGFTLIELLIVVAIIAILAAIAIPNFLAAQTRAKVADVKSAMRTIATGLESYYVDQNVYVPTDGVIDWFPPGRNIWEQLYRLTTPIVYITKVPGDRFNYTNTGYARPFYYESDEPKYDPADPIWGNSWPGKSWPEDSNWGESGAKWPGQLASTKWMLWSTEPDLIACWDPRQNIWPYRQYDPTNGVMSKGDIWRMGPGNYGAN
ncbi:MAG: prepilin-type N-terminal cleavage/methylation domain-containing protein [bacterium]|nr:prepilin-type N-terminal cleavage/methylation domain-containing protein [bacterium]